MPIRSDIQVINQGYDTSGNGGRKLVKLSNGWLVTTAFTGNAGTATHYIYVSKDNGSTWTQLCYLNNSTAYKAYQLSGGISLQSFGNKVYISVIRGSETSSMYALYSFVIDATTQTNINIDTQKVVVDDSQSSANVSSLAINETGTELHATWSSKNATYPNSFNIRYCKGTINADGSVTWGSVIQVTNYNTAGQDNKNPSIALNSIGEPMIFCDFMFSGSNSLIKGYKATGWLTDSDATWKYKNIYSSGSASYIQSSPSAIFIPQEVALRNNAAYTQGLHVVAWHGMDLTDTSKYNIHCMASIDGGATWFDFGVTGNKITSGNTKSQMVPSITASRNGIIDIVWEAESTATSYKRLRRIQRATGGWGSIIEVSDNTTANHSSPSTLFDLSINQFQPLYIYTNNVTPKVGFYGLWTITVISDSDGYLGEFGITLTKAYTITTPTADFAIATVVEKLDGVQTKSYSATASLANTFDLSSTFNSLSIGMHTITLVCNYEVRTWTFKKIYGTNSKPSDMLTALLSLTGVNQKDELKAVLLSKGLTILDTDSMATMITRLNASSLKRSATGIANTDGSGIITVTGLVFKPKMIHWYYNGNRAGFAYDGEVNSLYNNGGAGAMTASWSISANGFTIATNFANQTGLSWYVYE